MRYSTLISIAFSIVLSDTGTAQTKITVQPLPGHIFRHIDYTDGLLNNEVFAITQDSLGFIWTGTKKGLQRYDGSRFLSYFDSSDNPGENVSVTSLFPDVSNNQIWVTQADFQIKQFRSLQNEFISLHPEQIIKQGGIKYTDWNNDTWELQFDYKQQSDKSKKKLVGCLLLKEPKAGRVYFKSFLADSLRNEIWVVDAAQGGLLLFDHASLKIYSANFNPHSQPLLTAIKGKGYRFRDIIMDSRNNIWITTWSHIFFRFDTKTKHLSTYSMTDIINAENKGGKMAGSANAVMEDNHHQLWIGTTNGGLLLWDAQKDNFSYIIYKQGNTDGIQYKYEINCLFQDKEENIWVGTDNGICIFNPYRQYYTLIQNEPYQPQSLPKSEINAMIETNRGDLLIGMWGGGISVYDKSLHFKKNIRFEDVLQKNDIWSFAQLDEGTIWAGCQHGYLHVIDPDKLSVRTIHPPELENSTIRCMIKDSLGNLWLGLHNGKIVEWNNEIKKFIVCSFINQADSLSASPVISMLIDHSQNIWVSTWNGFRQFDAGKHQFTATYKPDKKNKQAIASSSCHGIEEYDDSTLLVGTEDGGLVFFNKKEKTFTQPVINNEKAPYSVHAIKKDRSGNIWFTTNYTIYEFTHETNKFIAYAPGNGVISSSFTGTQFLITQSGQLFTWTNDKIVGFYPQDFTESPTNKIPVTISGFKVFDHPKLIDSLLYAGNPVKLSYRENFFTVEFSALNFSNLLQTNYYYRLNGIDKDWVNSGTKGFANYTDLKPGEYIFEVKAENGISSGETTSFKIFITPPFWKSTGFRIAAGLLLLGSIFWFYRKKIQSVRHEAGLKQKIAETEMMALRAQMNPHFIFNSLNSIDNLIQTNQKDKATTYLVKFAKLIRSVLDSSKNNVISFQKDYETLQLYLQMEQFRCSNKFTYQLEAEEELLNSDYKVPPLIVQPFVENAIHHGLLNKQNGDRKLTVSATLENNCIIYAVKDNGVGRARAQQIKEINKPEYQSYGINITTERIHLYNQNGENKNVTITDLFENNEPSGTKVEIRLKIYDTN